MDSDNQDKKDNQSKEKEAASVQFSSLDKEKDKGKDKENKKNMFDEAGNMDVILDIPVTVSLEVGRTSLSIKELLKLNQGSIVELARDAGEPLDVLVNGTLIARGEVVVVNEKFGIRLTDVVNISQRMENVR